MRSGGTRCHCPVLFFHQGLAAWTVRTVRMGGELGEERQLAGETKGPQHFFLVCWGKIIRKEMIETGGEIVLGI